MKKIVFVFLCFLILDLPSYSDIKILNGKIYATENSFKLIRITDNTVHFSSEFGMFTLIELNREIYRKRTKNLGNNWSRTKEFTLLYGNPEYYCIEDLEIPLKKQGYIIATDISDLEHTTYNTHIEYENQLEEIKRNSRPVNDTRYNIRKGLSIIEAIVGPKSYNTVDNIRRWTSIFGY